MNGVLLIHKEEDEPGGLACIVEINGMFRVFAGIGTTTDGKFVVYDMYHATPNMFADKTFDTYDEAETYIESVFALESN